jgi:hypothetical protein
VVLQIINPSKDIEMEFLKELFGVEELSQFFDSVAGNTYMLYDYLFLVLGTYILQRIIRGRATFLLIFIMTLFVTIFHYNADKTITEAVILAYNSKGIGYFRQEIFIGILVLAITFLSRFDDSSSLNEMIPVFVIVESMNIYHNVFSEKQILNQWPFWVVIVFLVFYFSISKQAETDRKIEERILNGTASESDSAYWLKRKKEKEEDDDFY